MNEDLGLSDRDKELKKWNAPYVYREFPKMLFRGTTTTAGKVEIEQRIVASQSEEVLALGAGWCVLSQAAHDAETKRQEDLGTAAAERAAADRRMSAAAQAEAAAADATTAKHLPEIRERPIRRRTRKKKPPELQV